VKSAASHISRSKSALSHKSGKSGDEKTEKPEKSNEELEAEALANHKILHPMVI
jgi:hypothetical protein